MSTPRTSSSGGPTSAALYSNSRNTTHHTDISAYNMPYSTDRHHLSHQYSAAAQTSTSTNLPPPPGVLGQRSLHVHQVSQRLLSTDAYGLLILNRKMGYTSTVLAWEASHSQTAEPILRSTKIKSSTAGHRGTPAEVL